MILQGRFIGRIEDKKGIGYEGVAETLPQKDFAARIMLVRGIPFVTESGDQVTISWPDARILSVRKTTRALRPRSVAGFLIDKIKGVFK